MKVFVVLSSLLFWVACASGPQSKTERTGDLIVSQTVPWFASIENLSPDKCHSQLHDLKAAFEEYSLKSFAPQVLRAEIQTLSLKRWSLQQKITEWFREDPTLSEECVRLSAQLQSTIEDHERRLAQRTQEFQNLPSEQLVFMNSDLQLFSNIYLNDPAPTSLSDLKNGDVVMTWISGYDQASLQALAVVKTRDDGRLEMLMPLNTQEWLPLPVSHSESWLKIPTQQVKAFRFQDPKKSEALVRAVEKSLNPSKFSRAREPAQVQAVWKAVCGCSWSSPEEDPNMITLFEWKNYKALAPRLKNHH